MSKVWIVLRNSKVDEVFDNEKSAQAHAQMLTKKWSITSVIEKDVRMI